MQRKILLIFMGLFSLPVAYADFDETGAYKIKKPFSYINEVETFVLDCDAIKEIKTTLDMSNCYGIKLTQVTKIKDQYLAVARKIISNETDGEYNRLLNDFDQEEANWKKFSQSAGTATYSSYGLGSGRGVASLVRKINLTIQRTKDIWQNWIATKPFAEESILPRPEIQYLE